jgi:hypothetical protein
MPSIPGDPTFGGRILHYGLRADGFNPADAHSTYFDENSTSLKGMAKVITGH